MERFSNLLRRCFDPNDGARHSLIARWIFLRLLAGIYFSAFLALVFQIQGLIGPQGILPADRYLPAVARVLGLSRYWRVPTLFWLSASAPMLTAVTWIGLVASLIALLNLWPRLSFAICFVCFLSFVTAAQDFSNYQSDGMLLEAGFIALFFAPRGLRPGWGADHPPSRASLFLLQWEWFRIYFESGVVKLLSGDPEWRNFTAMDEYYQNGPLPTWIGWYVQHLPHWFHAGTAVLTLVLELALVWVLFFPRRVRMFCFCIVTPWEIGVILTGNYAFLNYLVLSLGVLLLDDGALRRVVPKRFQSGLTLPEQAEEMHADEMLADERRRALARVGQRVGVAVGAVFLTWVGYATIAELVAMLAPTAPVPFAPVQALEPFRISNRYGLFAVMTRGRYEIEFQGSDDGRNWQPYLFRHKPQQLDEAPGIYAPYQPRFDWNLWFASLGDWQQNDIVPLTEEQLLANDGAVLSLFRVNPFRDAAPRYIRVVLWQYGCTSMQEKRATGNWWRRQWLGLYAPTLTRAPDGRYAVVQPADDLPTHD